MAADRSTPQAASESRRISTMHGTPLMMKSLVRQEPFAASLRVARSAALNLVL
jgi:hypothetical protein